VEIIVRLFEEVKRYLDESRSILDALRRFLKRLGKMTSSVNGIRDKMEKLRVTGKT